MHHLVMANRGVAAVKSEDHISKDVDSAMDRESPSGDHVMPGVSIRNGPMEVDEPSTNGNANGKRKSRASLTNGKSYKDASSSEEDDKPLVRLQPVSVHSTC
jgi:DNA topoisomerase-1